VAAASLRTKKIVCVVGLASSPPRAATHLSIFESCLVCINKGDQRNLAAFFYISKREYYSYLLAKPTIWRLLHTTLKASFSASLHYVNWK
jgi:hypothetical protein